MIRISDSFTVASSRSNGPEVRRVIQRNFSLSGSCSDLGKTRFGGAPGDLSSASDWVPVPLVDKAGWTEVVILGEQAVLPDFILGCFAATVNASVDQTWAGTNPEAGSSDIGVFGHQGLFEPISGSFSCPNNYEVTI